MEWARKGVKVSCSLMSQPTGTASQTTYRSHYGQHDTFQHDRSRELLVILDISDSNMSFPERHVNQYDSTFYIGIWRHFGLIVTLGWTCHVRMGEGGGGDAC